MKMPRDFLGGNWVELYEEKKEVSCLSALIKRLNEELSEVEAEIARSEPLPQELRDTINRLQGKYDAINGEISDDKTRKYNLIGYERHLDFLLGRRKGSLSPKKREDEIYRLGGREAIKQKTDEVKLEIADLEKLIGKKYQTHARYLELLKRLRSFDRRAIIRQTCDKRSLRREIFARLMILEKPAVIGVPWFYRANAKVKVKREKDNKYYAHVFFGGDKRIEDETKDGHGHYKFRIDNLKTKHIRLPARLFPALLCAIYDLFFWEQRPMVTHKPQRA
ncbi:MAG: hypothetical protein LBK50_00425 [Candidatus Nomurabacteria bacterium]|nr:hypothetical protein [Candidatus Nomurabacteria bacterium]